MSSLPELPAAELPPLELITPEEHRDAIGAAAELTAHALSITRGVGGVALAHEIETTPDYLSGSTFTKFALLAATDAEGHLARWGRARQGKDESIRRPFNAWVDQMTDKLLIDATTNAIANREISEGHFVYGGVVKATAAIYTARDVATSVDRAIAERQDIDTRARGSGKLKTLVQIAVTGAALTPMAKTRTGRAVLGAGFAYSAGMSLKSGRDLHRHFKEARAAKKAAA